MKKIILFQLVFPLFISGVFAQQKEKISDEEYHALVDFYNAMNGSQWNIEEDYEVCPMNNGSYWDISRNTLHEIPWCGVITENGHVTGLYTSSFEINGRIPESFTNLKHLRVLYLGGLGYPDDPDMNFSSGGDDIGGPPPPPGSGKEHYLTIPDLKIIAKLENLEELDLYSCHLKGNVPMELTQMPKLRYLDLSWNQLEGIDGVFSSEVYVNLGYQKIELGEIRLTKEAMIKGTPVNYYNQEEANNFMTIGRKYFDIPKEGILLHDTPLFSTSINTDIKTKFWEFDNNAKIRLQQNSGVAGGSVIIFYVPFKNGDTNIDNRTNILDVQTVLNYLFSVPPEYLNYTAADTNKDSSLNILDIVGLVNLIQATTIEQAGNGNTRKVFPVIELSIENRILYANILEGSVASFDIRLAGINTEELKEQVSSLGYAVSVTPDSDGNISILGFTQDKNKYLSGKVALAQLSKAGNIKTAILADSKAEEIPFEIRGKQLGTDETLNNNKNRAPDIYPNPFKEGVNLRYYLAEKAGQVSLQLYNTLGQEVKTVNSLPVESGEQMVYISLSDLPSGVYYTKVNIYQNENTSVYKNKIIKK